MNLRTAISVALILCLAIVSPAQWSHELIYKGASAIQRDARWAWVNPSGQVAYTLSGPGVPYSHGFRDRTDITSLYLGNSSEAYATGMNASGQVVLRGHTIDSLHVNVEGRDFFTETHGHRTDIDVFTGGVDVSGLAWWGTDAGSNVAQRVFHGVDEISRGRDMRDIIFREMNTSGHSVWMGREVNVNGFRLNLYYDDMNYSLPILGVGGTMGDARINERGDVLWSGKGPNTAGKPRLFLNDHDISSSIFPDATIVTPMQATNNHRFWYARSGGKYHIMLDDSEVGAFLPSPAFAVQLGFINEPGDVLWVARDDVNQKYEIYKNEQNLSGSLLGKTDGNDPYIEPLGLDQFGNALWHGSGEKTGHKNHIFVNQFDLSMDALGDDNYDWAFGLKIGLNGHVLWQVGNNDGTVDLWLSTPVPEPAAIFVVSFLAVCTGWGRKMRPKS